MTAAADSTAPPQPASETAASTSKVVAILNAERCCSVEAAITQVKDQLPARKEDLEKLTDYYQKMLYHEACVLLHSILADCSPEQSVLLVNSVCTLLISRIAPIQIALFVDEVTERLDPHDGNALADRFLGLLQARMDPTVGQHTYASQQEAYTLLRVIKGVMCTRLQLFDEARKILLEELAEELKSKTRVTTLVNSKYYLACSILYKALNKPSDLYESIYTFITYTRLETLTEAQLGDIARDVCVAGLLSSAMFDFADLRSNSILTALRDEDKWLEELVAAASEGNLQSFQSIMAANKNDIQRVFGESPTVYADLENKIRLSALADLAFHRRSLKPSEIQKHCLFDTELDAHRLIIRALTLGVIKGSIDGVDDELRVSWVLPRVVDQQRIDAMRDIFKQWSDKIAVLRQRLEKSTSELLVA